MRIWKLICTFGEGMKKIHLSKASRVFEKEFIIIEAALFIGAAVLFLYCEAWRSAEWFLIPLCFLIMTAALAAVFFWRILSVSGSCTYVRAERIEMFGRRKRAVSAVNPTDDVYYEVLKMNVGGGTTPTEIFAVVSNCRFDPYGKAEKFLPKRIFGLTPPMELQPVLKAVKKSACQVILPYDALEKCGIDTSAWRNVAEVYGEF